MFKLILKSSGEFEEDKYQPAFMEGITVIVIIKEKRGYAV